MKTLRRDALLRKAKAGKLVAVGSYHFDDMMGMSQLKDELPVRIKEDHQDWKDGFVNLTPFDFKSRSGSAWENPDGTITLIVHSNSSYTFRVKED